MMTQMIENPQSLLEWWQTLPFRIDPVFLEIGPLSIRYYGIFFASAILVAYLISIWRLEREDVGYQKTMIGDYFTWVLLGVLVGGRLGYVLFYNLEYFIQNPLEIFLPFDVENDFAFTGIGGMSFHGGMLGVLAVTYFFTRSEKIKFWRFTDYIMPAIPAGYTLGRIGNFLNGELYGRPTGMPWGMYFPDDFQTLLRHPSQLYEGLFEGIVLFIILWRLREKEFFPGFLFCIYLLGYGFFRFLLEFTRQPDPHLGLVWGSFSMGQILCLAMMGAAGVLALYLKKMTAKDYP